MGPLGEVAYRTKLLLLNLFGPATLDEEHDPIAQLKREHEEELRQEKAAESDDTEAQGL